MNECIAEAKNLVKSYKQGDTEVEVLKGLNLTIATGETIAVLGESGSGKTTFLSLLAGLDAPDKGEVYLAGEAITRMPESELTSYRARNLSIVFQQFHLMPYLNIEENVMLPLEIAKVDGAAARAREAISRVGLSHRIKHLPHQLSGGEKQRVAIARALVARPKLLLADEPSGNLDSRTGETVMNLLFEQVSQLGMALVLVTHSEALAGRCQKRLQLKDGVLL